MCHIGTCLSFHLFMDKNTHQHVKKVLALAIYPITNQMHLIKKQILVGQPNSTQSTWGWRFWSQA